MKVMLLAEKSIEAIAPSQVEVLADIVRSVAAAAHLLHLAGDRMPFGRLWLMLYLADRAAIDARSGSITKDDYAATPLGPLPITIVRLTLHDGAGHPEWKEAIEKRGEEVVLLNPPDGRALSKQDRLLLDLAHGTLGNLGAGETLEFIAETCPEWLANLGKVITVKEILVALGESISDAVTVAVQLTADRERAQRRRDFKAA